MNSEALLQRFLLGEATNAEIDELDRLLASDPELRSKLIFEAGTDAGLREIALERVSDPVSTARNTVSPTFQLVSWAAAAAVIGMLATSAWSQFTRPSFIATLVSVEDASWESSLPTAPGSELTSGYLKLTAGLATIRFESGAEVLLEAPANLVLISPMRGKLVAGAAVVSVPEPAIGFVLETPGGYVVDHGTQFAVNVAESKGRADFEVIDGEISVYLSTTGEEVRLTDRQSASISEQTITSFDGHMPEKALEQAPSVLRIGTDGRAASVIRNNKRKKRIHPDMLTVKRSPSEDWDRRSFFEFDLSKVDLESVETARLRLNLVPSGIGFKTRLPKINRFAVYGLTNDDKEGWEIESLWEDSPMPEDGKLLGTFDIPRSQQRGSFGITNGKLLDFLKAKASRSQPVTLILVRETGQIDGEGPGLVHAFANDSHPEASGPMLEFLLSE